ncbi:uncharacterized protein LOC110278583 [Arachis duranensis]|uniref:Uncharacterized protein LOC110278583 n=1 Tax=Arachis duranensis TaxID=130453 RepID=A0A6P5NBG2_ARADU|nr:uncharacterized protein LOC110278583 [Arachis duranensis]
MIIQGESETLYEYWKHFNNLLNACPHHMIDKLVLISYFTQGMKPQDKTTLDGASNGSLKKYKTTEEAWQLIADLVESARNHKHNRNNHPKAVAEVSSSSENNALTQSICEMTNLLKQIYLGQQQSQPPSPQHSQQLVSQRVCGICTDYSHYTDECPQLQHENNTVAATHNFYDRPNQGYYQQGGNYNQGGNFNQGKPSSILLGRPLLKTSKFKSDAFSGTYSFEIDGRAVSFNLNEAMKHPPEGHSIFQCDIIDETIAVVHQEEVEEAHMEQGPSVGNPSEHNEDIIPSPLALDDPVPSQE